jgi:hypothetical protein
MDCANAIAGAIAIIETSAVRSIAFFTLLSCVNRCAQSTQQAPA